MLNTCLFLLFGLILPALLCCSRVSESFYLDLNVAESTPEERHLLHYPADGMKVGVNPPGFTWTGNESAENYSFVLSRIREAIDAGEMPFWEFCRHLDDSALAEPLYPEPAPYKDGKFEASEWRRIYTPGKVGSPHHNLWTRMKGVQLDTYKRTRTVLWYNGSKRDYRRVRAHGGTYHSYRRVRQSV